VIAAKYDRQGAVTDCSLCLAGELSACDGDGGHKVRETGACRRQLLASRNLEISGFVNDVAKAAESLGDARNSNGGRSHIDTTASRAQVHRNADQTNVGHTRVMGESQRKSRKRM
jgi:hypothetical protein